MRRYRLRRALLCWAQAAQKFGLLRAASTNLNRIRIRFILQRWQRCTHAMGAASNARVALTQARACSRKLAFGELAEPRVTFSSRSDSLVCYGIP